MFFTEKISLVLSLKNSNTVLEFDYYFKFYIVASGGERPSSNAFYFVGKPQDTELKWGRSTILEALADSNNRVTYKWYKDGNAIQLSVSKVIVGKGNLKIVHAKDEDTGTYKVVAQSSGQTIEASAKVVVLSMFSNTIQI